MKRGMTLMELLVSMAIFAILGAGVFFLYRSFISQRIVQTTLVRTEGDLTYFQQYFSRLISSAGFGIPAEATDVLSGGGNSLNIRTLIAGQNRGTGCFRVLGADGNVVYVSDFDVNGRPCTGISYTRCLDLEKKQNCTKTPRVEFFDPGTDKIRLDTSNSSLPSQCLPGTVNLRLGFGDSTPQPVISCIANFKVLCIYKDGNIDTNCNFDGSQTSVVLCFFVQLNQKAPEGGQSLVEPTFRGPCLEGNDPSRPENKVSDDVPDWSSVRWAVVEWVIDLPNIR